MIHINLDSLIYDYSNNEYGITEDIILSKIIELLPENVNNLLLTILVENFNWNKIDTKLIPFIVDYMNKYHIKVYWIFNDIALEYYRFNNNINNNIIFINFFALKTYYKIFFQGQLFNKKWNYNSNLGLFIPGKLYKKHRIGVLYYLYKENLLDKCLYSAYLDIDSEILKNIILDIDSNCNIDFNDFFTKCNKKLDIISNNIDEKNNFLHYWGFPYDVSIYEDTLISLISETNNVDNIVFLTEKTFRPIVNKHPFLMIGPYNSNKKLNDLGFKTFEKYMYYTNYDINSNNSKIIEVCKNFEYFLNNSYKYRNEINDDIEYNFQMFKSFCENEIKKINNFTNNSIDPLKIFNNVLCSL